MPVKAHAYRTLAEMNTGLEQAIQSLETLRKISYFSSNSIAGIPLPALPDSGAGQP
jgi:hypothetical protein